MSEEVPEKVPRGTQLQKSARLSRVVYAEPPAKRNCLGKRIRRVSATLTFVMVVLTLQGRDQATRKRKSWPRATAGRERWRRLDLLRTEQDANARSAELAHSAAPGKHYDTLKPIDATGFVGRCFLVSGAFCLRLSGYYKVPTLYSIARPWLNSFDFSMLNNLTIGLTADVTFFGSRFCRYYISWTCFLREGNGPEKGAAVTRGVRPGVLTVYI